MLNIEKTIENGKARFALEGRLDTVTSQELEQELIGSLEGVAELTLDFEKLEHLSSAGLRVLLIAQKTMTKQGGEMKVVRVNDVIMGIFETTGFSDILVIE
ncbi:MAG: STAS domain-containing protein [Oscillospiraceae bacterium]|jgi:anti-sigma B factor antagonist|nr:STAS domain-containing protein [Oscillospiraceae bacterium]